MSVLLLVASFVVEKKRGKRKKRPNKPAAAANAYNQKQVIYCLSDD